MALRANGGFCGADNILYGVSFTEVVTQKILAREHLVSDSQPQAACRPLAPSRRYYNAGNADGQEKPLSRQPPEVQTRHPKTTAAPVEHRSSGAAFGSSLHTVRCDESPAGREAAHAQTSDPEIHPASSSSSSSSSSSARHHDDRGTEDFRLIHAGRTWGVFAFCRDRGKSVWLGSERNPGASHEEPVHQSILTSGLVYGRWLCESVLNPVGGARL